MDCSRANGVLFGTLIVNIWSSAYQGLKNSESSLVFMSYSVSQKESSESLGERSSFLFNLFHHYHHGNRCLVLFIWLFYDAARLHTHCQRFSDSFSLTLCLSSLLLFPSTLNPNITFFGAFPPKFH